MTYPEAGNIGGGGFMTLYIHISAARLISSTIVRQPRQGLAPICISTPRGEPVPNLSLVGDLSAGVPGTVRGFAEAHRLFGKLSWAQDLAPAIRYASLGYRVLPEMTKVRDSAQAGFAVTNFAHYFGGMKAGRTFRQPELAATLRRIAEGGDKEFYQGRTADLLVAQMARGQVKGLITKADLAAYKAVWREPVEGDWKGFPLITAPPPSSGGVALLQLLGMKEDAAPLFQSVSLNSPQYLHLISGIEKRVFADRADYMGDPDFVKVPVVALSDPAKPSVLAAVKPAWKSRKPPTSRSSIAGATPSPTPTPSTATMARA